MLGTIPEGWIKDALQKNLTNEDKEKIKSLGGWDKLLETLKERLEEQKKRHQGGNKWIGTGGTSPFGSGGYNPEGVRIGNEGQRQGRAVKVWEKRLWTNFDDKKTLGIRDIRVAVRRLRHFAKCLNLLTATLISLIPKVFLSSKFVHNLFSQTFTALPCLCPSLPILTPSGLYPPDPKGEVPPVPIHLFPP